jgi:hypothetical protein
MAKVAEWVDGYRGKIVQLIAGEESFHLVFTRQGVSLRRGEYPSCEITYSGEEGIILQLLQGQTTTSAETKGGRLTIWGNMHESLPFEAVLRSAV